MRLILWLLQLALIALALPGRNQLGNKPRTPSLLPSIHTTTSGASLGAPSSKPARVCKKKPPQIVPSRTKISKSTPTPTSTISTHSLGCHALPVEPNPGPLCVCTNGFTTQMTVASECPTTIPADWTTHAPEPTTSTSQIPYSYYNITNGALVHCASSIVSKLDVYTGITETYCAGSTSTDSNSLGVTYTTTLWPQTTTAVTYGNWGYYSPPVSSTFTYDATSAAYSLAVSFYTAFSSACPSSAIATVTTTTDTSYNTFATLPGGATGSFTTTTTEVTLYSCTNQATPSAAPWWVASSESTDGIDNSGTLAVTITDSSFTEENFPKWLWALAYRFAHATVNSMTNETILREEGRGQIQMDFPFYRVPTDIMLVYGNSINSGTGLERLSGSALFEESSEEELECEIMEDMEVLLDTFLAFIAGPEGAALADTVGFTISSEARAVMQDSMKASKFVFGCPGEE